MTYTASMSDYIDASILVKAFEAHTQITWDMVIAELAPYEIAEHYVNKTLMETVRGLFNPIEIQRLK